jgi:hypothetical protein
MCEVKEYREYKKLRPGLLKNKPNEPRLHPPINRTKEWKNPTNRRSVINWRMNKR